MTQSKSHIHTPSVLVLLCSVSVLSAACSSSVEGQPKTTNGYRPSASASDSAPSADADQAGSTSGHRKTAIERTARLFTKAYAEHDARDGADGSYADAGVRASRFAHGELAGLLAHRRSSQDAVWSALRAQQACQTAEITSTVVPDGAPAPTSSAALIRVGYTLTTTPKSGPVRHSNEQLALRLERTSEGWRVTDLPWA
ncbi:hypothetical protein [Streptomyces sp. NPDC060194]|uniref:hypothetical protein n=1 Tax=Streptomyces sp. NPDC060194 TaxID=3347069 RepID=UPI003654FF05